MSSRQISERGTGLRFDPELLTPPMRKKELVGPKVPEGLNGIFKSIPPTAPRREGGVTGLDDVLTLDQNWLL
jgi:hypothetical protein